MVRLRCLDNVAPVKSARLTPRIELTLDIEIDAEKTTVTQMYLTGSSVTGGH